MVKMGSRLKQLGSHPVLSAGSEYRSIVFFFLLLCRLSVFKSHRRIDAPTGHCRNNRPFNVWKNRGCAPCREYKCSKGQHSLEEFSVILNNNTAIFVVKHWRISERLNICIALCWVHFLGNLTVMVNNKPNPNSSN